MKKFIKKELGRWTDAVFHPTFLFPALLGNIVLVITTIVVYKLEKGINPQINNYFDSLWWGVTTITTIGYGDIVPVTFWGRLIGMGLMFTGPVLFVLFTGVLLKLLVKEEMEKELMPLEKEIRKGEMEDVEIEKHLHELIKKIDKIEKKLK